MFDLNDLTNTKFRVSRRLQQRGIADYIESLVADTLISRHNATQAGSKRSIEDVMVGDSTYVDIKTTDINANFSMPNLISIERLRKLYQNPENQLVYIFVDYEVIDEELDASIYTQVKYAEIKSIEVRPIETISWCCMHIQSLGNGQLQLKNAHNTIKRYEHSRDEWLAQLKSEALLYIEKQLSKLCKYRENWV